MIRWQFRFRNRLLTCGVSQDRRRGLQRRHRPPPQRAPRHRRDLSRISRRRCSVTRRSRRSCARRLVDRVVHHDLTEIAYSEIMPAGEYTGKAVRAEVHRLRVVMRRQCPSATHRRPPRHCRLLSPFQLAPILDVESRLFLHTWSIDDRAGNKPFREEPLSSERLEERALALAANFTIDPRRRRARSIYPRLRDNERVLAHAYRVAGRRRAPWRVRHARPPSGSSTTST